MNHSAYRKKSSYTLLEMMVTTGIASVVLTAGMLIFITLYRTSADAQKQIRVQRKADILIERLSRGPFGGYGGIRGAYLNTSLAGNSLPNPTGGTVGTIPGSNVFQKLDYYAQTNFANFANLSGPVGSLTTFLSSYSNSVARYTIGYNTTNKYIYYKINNTGSEKPIIDLEDIDLAYLRFSGGLFQLNINPTYQAVNNYAGTNYVFENPSNLILMEFALPYLTADGRRRITNHFSAKVYIRNNF